MQFKKSVLLPVILSVIGVFVSTIGFILIQVAAKVNNTTTGPSPLAIVELVLFVLLLSALSAKRPLFAKIVNIISLATVMGGLFVTALVVSISFQYQTVTWDSISYLAISILSMVAMILFFIYYLIGKKEMLAKLAKIMNIICIAILVIFGGLLIVSSFVGMYKNLPFYGFELAVIVLNVALLLGVTLSLQGNLTPKEENQSKE